MARRARNEQGEMVKYEVLSGKMQIPNEHTTTNEGDVKPRQQI